MDKSSMPFDKDPKKKYAKNQNSPFFIFSSSYLAHQNASLRHAQRRMARKWPHPTLYHHVRKIGNAPGCIPRPLTADLPTTFTFLFGHSRA